MSYVDLKHLLADLALEAIREPETTTWVGMLAAYGELAEVDRPAVDRNPLIERAGQLGDRFAWRPTERDIQYLVRAGLLEKREQLISARTVFVLHLPYLKRQAARLLDAMWELKRTPALPSVSDAVRRGAALFNAGLFFECHEWLEGAWKATNGPAKNCYHGIVQVAAAFYHDEKHNLHGARTLLAKAMRRLEPYPSIYEGMDLGKFRENLRRWGAHFEGGVRPEAYPRIGLTAELESRLYLQLKKGAPRG